MFAMFRLCEISHSLQNEFSMVAFLTQGQFLKDGLT